MSGITPNRIIKVKQDDNTFFLYSVKTGSILFIIIFLELALPLAEAKVILKHVSCQVERGLQQQCQSGLKKQSPWQILPAQR